MKYLKNESFQKDLKNSGVDDEHIKIVLDDIFKGRTEPPLGHKMYKIRGAKAGKGKRGGFRALFFWKRDELIIFCVLFMKNEQDNISADERKALRILSKEYDNLTEDDIKKRIERKTFMEIKYEKQSQ